MKTINLKLILIVICLSFTFFTHSEINDVQQELLKQLPPDQRSLVLDKMNESNEMQEELDEIFENPGTLIKRPEQEDSSKECPKCIFGYEFFKYAPTTFAPTDNMAISSEYILGPGDKLEITLYGNEELKFKGFISREGIINIPSLGPINFTGMAFKDASKFLTEKVNNELIGTSAFLSLSELRSISVYVLGQAYKPGKYTISGLSSLSNALFISGGVNEVGSLRNIELRRNNTDLGTYDLYELILKGSLESDIQLRDGDVIFIPFIKNKVKIGGSFNRPDLYEFIEGEDLGDAIFLAGGYKSDVLEKSVVELSSVDRALSKRITETYSINDLDLETKLSDGDFINISGNYGLEVETIEVSGAIMKPGEYTINPGDTILDIINRAGGYTEDSYSEGAVYTRLGVAKEQKESFERMAEELEKTLVTIVQDATTTGGSITEFSLSPISSLITKLRELEPIGRQTVELDQIKLREDPYVNFEVRDGDKVFIPRRPNSVSVVGEVLNSQTLRYAPGNTIDDYLSQSGGLTDQADPDKIFIISPNGQANLVKKKIFSASDYSIIPGSTIVAPRDSKPLDALALTKFVTPILANLATTIAAIAAISDN